MNQLCLPSPDKFNLSMMENVLGGIRTRQDIERFEDYVCSLDESTGEDPFPLFHKFGAGTYTREIHLPKDQIVIGKIHRHESMVYVLSGKLIVADEKGCKLIEAPCQFVSSAGIKRVAYILEDVVWIDIHAVESDDIDGAEAEIFASSYADYDALCESVKIEQQADVVAITEIKADD